MRRFFILSAMACLLVAGVPDSGGQAQVPTIELVVGGRSITVPVRAVSVQPFELRRGCTDGPCQEGANQCPEAVMLRVVGGPTSEVETFLLEAHGTVGTRRWSPPYTIRGCTGARLSADLLPGRHRVGGRIAVTLDRALTRTSTHLRATASLPALGTDPGIEARFSLRTTALERPHVARWRRLVSR